MTDHYTINSVYIDYRKRAEQGNRAALLRSEIKRKGYKRMSKTQNLVFKKALVMIMAVMMVFTMMPSMAWATEEENANNETTQTQQGTAQNGYLQMLTFSEKPQQKDTVLEANLDYAFDQATTEYHVTLPDACSSSNTGYYLCAQLSSTAPSDAKLQIDVLGENGEYQTVVKNGDIFSSYLNGFSINNIPWTYDTETTVRVSIGKVDSETFQVIENSADVYYYHLKRKPVLALETLKDADGNNLYPSPAFKAFNKETDYKIYGTFNDDQEIIFSFASKMYEARNGSIFVDGKEFSQCSQNNVKLSKKYIELEQDENGNRWIQLQVIYENEEKGIKVEGETYTFTFINEEKVVFTQQPQGGTFQTDATKTHICTVGVQADADATISYQWKQSSQYKGNWRPFSNVIGNAGKKKELSLSLKKASNMRYYCVVTIEKDGETYVGKSETAYVYITTDTNSKISGPALQEGKGKTQISDAVYSVGESASKLAAVFHSIDNGAKVSMQWYRNTEKNYENGEPLEKTDMSGISDTDVRCAGEITPDTSKAGIWYYYCIGTCTLEEDGKTYTAVTQTPFATIEVKDANIDLHGEGSKENPWLITSYEDMQKLQEGVKSGTTFEGKFFKLTEDITLPETWEGLGSLKDGETIPSGSSVNPFSATLDGDGHTINMAEGCKGFIKYPRYAVVKNLNLYGKRIEGSALVFSFFIDYGKDNTYATGCPWPLIADNVTLKEGSQTLRAGLIMGGGSGANPYRLRNCTVEKGVTIGYDKKQSGIGSFCASFSGELINCHSAADVYGVDCVGGLAGSKAQSMGSCVFYNSSFTGSITATGEEVGGIIASGYNSASAPNTPIVTVVNCYVEANLTGKNIIGGILGTEPSCKDCWENGSGAIANNFFYGAITATESNAVVGGTVGFLKSLNKYQTVQDNYYLEGCGAEKAIGSIEILKDNLKPNETSISVKESAFTDGTLLKTLNNGSHSMKNWKQGENYPVHSGETVLYALELSGDYKTKYETGEKLDKTGMVIIGKLSDGSTRNISLSDENLKFTGFKSNQRGMQTITVTYGVAKTTYDVTVLYNSSQVKDISVYFTLLGDDAHGEPTEATGTHTLKDKNLPQTWVGRTSVDIDNNTTVYDVIKKVFKANGITWEESYSLGTAYIESLTKNGVTLGEFTNGNLSGWMYTLNGHHSNLGVAQQFLNDKDEIIFHYTDDYTVEEGSDHWNTPGGVVEEVKDVTTDTKTGTTTAPTEVKVSEKTAADGTKTKVAEVKVSADNQKEILKQAKEKKSNEIILVVPSKSVGDATKADVTLEKSFINSIVKDTDAKLTIKTPFGDKTYTQEELKAMSEAATGSTITVAIEKAAEEPTDDNANIAKAKSIVKDMKLVARSSKTTKKNIKAVLKSDVKVKASIKELKDLGFTVKYRFYRSTKKAASYKSTVTKKTATYTNTSGKKGTKYFYKVQVRVYDENGKLVAKTALKQCKYASRTWSKVK